MFFKKVFLFKFHLATNFQKYMKNKRKRNKSSPLVQNPSKKILIKDFFTQKMDSKVLSLDTLAACAEAEKDINALEEKSTDEIIREMARDIKDIKLQQALDKKELSDLKVEIQSLKNENQINQYKIKSLENELSNMKAQSMRNNLLFRNVASEGSNENIIAKVRHIFDQIGVPNSNAIRIERAHRLGRPGSNTPIVVKFSFYEDRMAVWQRRTALRGTGIYVNEHFPSTIEDRRRDIYPLLPFLKRKYGANKVFVKLDRLFCEGKEYTVDTIPKLLANIKEDPGAVADANTHVFLGKYSPLSNFFSCSITVDGNSYCSSEQAYQHAKASFAGNTEAAEAIKKEVHPVKIKHIGDDISSADWIESGAAATAMTHILKAKFCQVEKAKQLLFSTGKKRLGEANPSKNASYCATGLGQGSPNALNTAAWGKNKLGEILESVRNSLVQK